MRKLFIICIMALVASVTFAKEKKFVTHVTLTTYNAVASQCDDSPLITADGTKIDMKKLKRGKIKYCAVSRDLLWCIPLGSVVHIEGHGYYEVRDTMNERFDHYIDILQHTSQKNFKKEKIRVEVIKKGSKNGKKI
jgi:3D (Asp-Asp-Asp) domain-containing protein